MKCPDCGMDMEEGQVECIGAGWESYYEFTSEEEAQKKGIKGFFTKKTIPVPSTLAQSKAWHCANCKKVLMWIDAKE